MSKQKQSKRNKFPLKKVSKGDVKTKTIKEEQIPP